MAVKGEHAEVNRMFVALDTNHYNELTSDSSPGRKAQRRIEASGADVFISIIAVQEIFQGWLALINRQKSGRDQVHAYMRFQHSVETVNKLTILPFDDAAAGIFEAFRAQRLRVGTMDLKMAAICLAHEAVLLTRNVSDFTMVPGLRVENWLD
ncbi:MAG TPA: type II toxin-antitoxin system VapC family toxin [Verrucomicrobiae bacterium]|jgi:tRNA(fMet)-specific endonuclease VapC|nr:type II toxin-antitoxin system VapC family toxin [Verrucomicrobiae bacterium]